MPATIANCSMKLRRELVAERCLLLTLWDLLEANRAPELFGTANAIERAGAKTSSIDINEDREAILK